MEKLIQTTDDLLEVINRIDFEPTCLDMGWAWKTEPVYKKVDDEFVLRGWFISSSFRRPDTDTGKVGTGRGREWFIARGTSVSGVVKTCYVAGSFILTHEYMEAFLYDGQKIFDPHHTIEDLGAACTSKRERQSGQSF